MLYRPLIKTACLNAAKALLAQFFGAGDGKHAPPQHGAGSPGRSLSSQGQEKEALLFISRRREWLWTLRVASTALVWLFRPLSGSSYGVWKSEVGGHHRALQPLPRQGARGQALRVCAELEQEEEEGHHQSTHQDVVEEPRVGTCQTRKRKWGPWTGLLGALLQALARRRPPS